MDFRSVHSNDITNIIRKALLFGARTVGLRLPGLLINPRKFAVRMGEVGVQRRDSPFRYHLNRWRCPLR